MQKHSWTECSCRCVWHRCRCGHRADANMTWTWTWRGRASDMGDRMCPYLHESESSIPADADVAWTQTRLDADVVRTRTRLKTSGRGRGSDADVARTRTCLLTSGRGHAADADAPWTRACHGRGRFVHDYPYGAVRGRRRAPRADPPWAQRHWAHINASNTHFNSEIPQAHTISIKYAYSSRAPRVRGSNPIVNSES